MSTQFGSNIVEVLSESGNIDNTKSSVTKIMCQIKRHQERVRKHIEDNYVEFMPNHTTADLYLDEGESLVKEADSLLQNIASDTSVALLGAKTDLQQHVEQLQEATMGINVTYKILKADDLFQCIDEANANKDYLVVLDLLGKLKSVVYDKDDLFQKCECYDTIKCRYHIQSDILKQNLQQRFERMVQFIEKPFPNTKCVTLKVSKDESLLQDIVMALFQAKYNPIKISDFLLDNCLEPLIVKPVSIEITEDNSEYKQLSLSYSLKPLSGGSLRPSYKQVFENINLLFDCLGNINVSISETQHVFTILGDYIKERFLKLLIDECLMHSIPETMDEFQESTLVKDVLQFEQLLADTFLINPEIDHELTEFTEKFGVYFKNRFSRKILETAKDIMHRDLQDMTVIAEKSAPEDVANNPFMFPCCMVSKSTLDIVKLMERILRQPYESEDNEDDSLLNVISITLNMYIIQVPQIHKKLLESIPQQSALFYNNCMFLAHWVATNSEKGIPTFPALVKSLQAAATKYFDEQVLYQKNIIMGILREFDLSDAISQSLGAAPLKLIRQSLRQMDLLRNVWQNVLPDMKYNKTFTELLNDFCSEIIRRIVSMEDISATVANELSELIEIVLEKAPSLFKEKHQVIHIKNWMKLEQLKMILNASLQEITEKWCGGAGILTANYKAEEIKHLIRALFQNTDRRANALAQIVTSHND